MALTIQDLKDRIRVDFVDEMTDRDLANYMLEADLYAEDALGANYPADDARVKAAQCDWIRLSYDSSSLSEKERAALEKRIDKLFKQVRLKMKSVGDSV